MGSASNGMDNSKRKKGVNWSVQENELVIELFLTNYDMYYFKFADGSKRNSKALRDSLHERWAEQLTRLGFAERTSQQVAEKLKKSIILTRKFINNNNNNNGESTSKAEELPAYLRPLEKKLREECAKKAKGDIDPPNENTALRFFDLLKDVKEESESSPGAKDTSDTHSLDVDLDIEPSTSLYESPMSRLSRMANLPQSLDPPIAPVTPIKNNLLPPSVTDNSKKRAIDEELEDMNAKRQRLLNAELELVERKRYLVEMKIKYWEEKTKRLSST